ncbi:MAG: NAD(P)H-binding protein [bacterium]|nr:NAD(P)H-binding protein [bacterium]
MSAIYTTTRFGLAETITPHAKQLLGRDPISFQQFVQDYASIWANTKPDGVKTMKITIFGSTGGTGKELVNQALAAGREVTVYVRNPAKLTGLQDRVMVVQGNLEDRDAIGEAVAGAEAVISALGPTNNKPGNPLTAGMDHIVTASGKPSCTTAHCGNGGWCCRPERQTADDRPLFWSGFTAVC